VDVGERLVACARVRGKIRPHDYLCSLPFRNFARTIYYGYTCHFGESKLYYDSENFIYNWGGGGESVSFIDNGMVGPDVA